MATDLLVSPSGWKELNSGCQPALFPRAAAAGGQRSGGPCMAAQVAVTTHTAQQREDSKPLVTTGDVKQLREGPTFSHE